MARPQRNSISFHPLCSTFQLTTTTTATTTFSTLRAVRILRTASAYQFRWSNSRDLLHFIASFVPRSCWARLNNWGPLHLFWGRGEPARAADWRTGMRRTCAASTRTPGCRWSRINRRVSVSSGKSTSARRLGLFLHAKIENEERKSVHRASQWPHRSERATIGR